MTIRKRISTNTSTRRIASLVFFISVVFVVTTISYAILVFCNASLYVDEEYLWSHPIHADSTSVSRISTFLIPGIPDKRISSTLEHALPRLNSSENHPLRSCVPTSQVRVDVYGNAKGSRQRWMFQSLDAMGQPKQMGGDEFYVTYRDYNDPLFGQEVLDPTAVALVTDLETGQYSLDFVQPPLRVGEHMEAFEPKGYGELTVHFQYTCKIGRWNRSDKKSWRNNGSSATRIVLGNVTEPWSRPFASTILDSNNYPKWDLSKYDNVVCFGDSIMENFCGMWWKKFRFHKANVHCAGNLEMDYSTDMVAPILGKLERQHESLLQRTNETTAIVLGSAAWDVLTDRSSLQNHNFDDHIEAIRLVIGGIQKMYPSLRIFWKSPQAFHVHALKPNCFKNKQCALRSMHMSSSNSKFLHERQKLLMKDLHIPFIDLYDATYLSAAWMMDGDGRHYRQYFNWELMNFTYPKNFPETSVP